MSNFAHPTPPSPFSDEPDRVPASDMNKTYDRRFLAPLAFLFFLFFLLFLGTTNYRHLAALAAPASLASLAVLALIPRNADKVPPEYRLGSHAEVFRALLRKA